MSIPTAETLHSMGHVLIDIAAEINADFPIQANSLRNMAAELLAAR